MHTFELFRCVLINPMGIIPPSLRPIVGSDFMSPRRGSKAFRPPPLHRICCGRRNSGGVVCLSGRSLLFGHGLVLSIADSRWWSFWLLLVLSQCLYPCCC